MWLEFDCLFRRYAAEAEASAEVVDLLVAGELQEGLLKVAVGPGYGALDVGRGVRRYDPAFMNDRDQRADLLSHSQRVSGQKNRHPPRFGHLGEQILHQAHTPRVQSHHRLVNDEDLRLVQKR